MKKQEEAEKKNLLQVTQDFTKADLDSAISKITEAAIRYRAGDIDGAIDGLNATPPVAQVSNRMPIVSALIPIAWKTHMMRMNRMNPPVYNP